MPKKANKEGLLAEKLMLENDKQREKGIEAPWQEGYRNLQDWEKRYQARVKNFQDRVAYFEDQMLIKAIEFQNKQAAYDGKKASYKKQMESYSEEKLFYRERKEELDYQLEQRSKYENLPSFIVKFLEFISIIKGKSLLASEHAYLTKLNNELIAVDTRLGHDDAQLKEEEDSLAQDLASIEVDRKRIAQKRAALQTEKADIDREREFLANEAGVDLAEPKTVVRNVVKLAVPLVVKLRTKEDGLKEKVTMMEQMPTFYK